MPIQINSNTPLVRYAAASGQTTFTYNFPIFANADLKVVVNGTTQTLTTNYTVTGADTNSGGTVVFVSGLTTGDSVTIYSDIAIDRTIEYQDNGDLLADTLNTDFNRLTRQVQQTAAIGGDNTTGLRFDPDAGGLPLNALTGSVDARKGKALSFNDTTGQPEATFDLVENTTNKTAAEAAQANAEAEVVLAEAQVALATAQVALATTQAGLAEDWATKSTEVTAGNKSAKTYASEAAVSAANASAIQVNDGTITEPKLAISNAPSAGYILEYKDSTDKMTWVTKPSATNITASQLAGDQDLSGKATQIGNSSTTEIRFTSGTISFYVGGTLVAAIDASGNFRAIGNVVASDSTPLT